jgi:hypothetical protein
MRQIADPPLTPANSARLRSRTDPTANGQAASTIEVKNRKALERYFTEFNDVPDLCASCGPTDDLFDRLTVSGRWGYYHL